MREGLQEGPKLIPMAIQDEGGVSKTVMRAVGFLKELLPEANTVKREPIPASELILGAAVRRLGRLLGHLGQSGAGRGGRPAGAATAARRCCRKRRRSTAPSTC